MHVPSSSVYMKAMSLLKLLKATLVVFWSSIAMRIEGGPSGILAGEVVVYHDELGPMPVQDP